MISANEFLNGKPRWCLWLEEATPADLRSLPKVLEKVALVRQFRLNSIAPSTRKFAETPMLFRDRNRPKSYVLIPRVSSENRKYIPIGFFDDNSIVSDTCMFVPECGLFHFGILTSIMHMAWVKHVCGRLENRFRYSKDIVYNNYPWPENPTEKQVMAIEAAAQAVLDARELFPGSSLADLYDPRTMPPALVKAHNELDKAVDLAYRPQPFSNEAQRMEFLFSLYERYTADLFTREKPKRVRKDRAENP